MYINPKAYGWVILIIHIFSVHQFISEVNSASDYDDPDTRKAPSNKEVYGDTSEEETVDDRINCIVETRIQKSINLAKSMTTTSLPGK